MYYFTIFVRAISVKLYYSFFKVHTTYAISVHNLFRILSVPLQQYAIE